MSLQVSTSAIEDEAEKSTTPAIDTNSIAVSVDPELPDDKGNNSPQLEDKNFSPTRTDEAAAEELLPMSAAQVSRSGAVGYDSNDGVIRPKNISGAEEDPTPADKRRRSERRRESRRQGRNNQDSTDAEDECCCCLVWWVLFDCISAVRDCCI
ncbi:hypothetical protein ElyMa_004561500 [Elysia marginata]|uniref:Uncharacterized protein n=1 Tax=Elysia marginata TaxID=1093978 RepID=A0AAV4HR81_9GAST|nr:hypothetical protein ElyMa_004561500 [Elysia marginata]